MKILFLSLLVASLASNGEGQGTIRFDFDGVPVNTILGEQFGSLGVHFAGDNRYQYPSVIAAPPFPQSPGAQVGYSFPQGKNLGMWFDFPIASISMDVAVGRAGGPSGIPSWYLGALNGYPPSLVMWSSITPLSGFDTWTRVTLDVPPDRVARALEIQALNIYQGGNYNPAYFFDNIEVSFVPEPSVDQLVLIGVAAFICRWLFGHQGSA